VRNLLRPGGKEQELSLSPLDALARYGPAVVGAVAGAVTPGDALPALLVVKRGGP